MHWFGFGRETCVAFHRIYVHSILIGIMLLVFAKRLCSRRHNVFRVVVVHFIFLYSYTIYCCFIPHSLSFSILNKSHHPLLLHSSSGTIYRRVTNFSNMYLFSLRYIFGCIHLTFIGMGQKSIAKFVVPTNMLFGARSICTMYRRTSFYSAGHC